MPSAREYITELAARGRYHFTTQEALTALGGSLLAVRAALRRLSRRKELASPYRGFHVILPPEYRSLGCLPPEQFIPLLMQHLEERYYVALLSAAELHGAAHHRPQRFQVMIAMNRRPIDCGEVRVQFVARHDLAKTPVVEMNTPRGRMRVSSVEATALEVIGYADQCGGLDNVASILNELVESLDPPKLVVAAALCPIVWSQRLGYLLEAAEHGELAAVLAEHVRERAKSVAPLVRAKPSSGAPRVPRWKLAINERVEPDR
jgi:predicted transcriptional regulator of viral defense system